MRAPLVSMSAIVKPGMISIDVLLLIPDGARPIR
jgi:hypothetical protein